MNISQIVFVLYLHCDRHNFLNNGKSDRLQSHAFIYRGERHRHAPHGTYRNVWSTIRKSDRDVPVVIIHPRKSGFPQRPRQGR